MTRLSTPRGTSGISASTRAAIAWQAIAHRGVFSDGFQTTASPQTRASIAFQAQTATGKLKAVITPTGPSGMPLLGQAVPRPLAGDRQAVELPAQSHGKVAHVDHFLDFAQRLLGDLSHFPTLPVPPGRTCGGGIARRCGEPIRPDGGPARSARRKTPPRPHPPRASRPRPTPPGTKPATSRRWASGHPAPPHGRAASRGRSRSPRVSREPQADREVGESDWTCESPRKTVDHRRFMHRLAEAGRDLAVVIAAEAVAQGIGSNRSALA